MADSKKKIDPELKLISDYLLISDDCKYVIPEYQRAYSWKRDEQCDKLWEDIHNFIQDDRKEPYFFGTVIVDASHVEEGELQLIDGQQRTITFILLIKALLIRINETLDTIPNDTDSRKIKDLLESYRKKIIGILYKANDDEQWEILENWSLVYHRVLLESRSINEEDSYRNDLSSILKAKTFEEAEKYVHTIKYRRNDNKYTNFFRNFKFFYEKLGIDYSDSTALKEFSNVLLNRCQIIEIRSWQTEQAIMMFNSLNSTGMPLSDADIISAQLSAKSGSERNEFNKLWSEIVSITEPLSARKIIDTNAVLQQYMHIYTALQREIDTDKKASVTTEAMRSFYTVTQKGLLNNPLALCSNFKKIATIWERIQDYPIVKLALKFNMNLKLFLASYLFRFNVDEISSEKVVGIAETLIRLFAVMELVQEGYSSSKFKVFLFTEQIKLVRDEIRIETIKKDFDEHIRLSWEEAYIRSLLDAYDKNVLVFLNEYLYAKEKQLPFDFSPSVQVEHIMPQSGHNIDAIRLDAGFESTPDGKAEFKELVDKIGNKIMIEEKINKAIGNEWFRSKKGQPGDTNRYTNSQYNMAKALSQYPNDKWTKDDIDNATNQAIDRIISFIYNK